MTRSICILDGPPPAMHTAIYCCIITDISVTYHMRVVRLYISTNFSTGACHNMKTASYQYSNFLYTGKTIPWSSNHFNGKYIFREMVFILKCLLLTLSQFVFACMVGSWQPSNKRDVLTHYKHSPLSQTIYIWYIDNRKCMHILKYKELECSRLAVVYVIKKNNWNDIQMLLCQYLMTDEMQCYYEKVNIIITPLQQSWTWVYWFYVVPPSVCLSVDVIVFALYLLQHQLDFFYIYTSF